MTRDNNAFPRMTRDNNAFPQMTRNHGTGQYPQSRT